ncbi:hypothetical protein ACF08O_08260 [Streptomyces paradoxus]|uniref:hypothetical protein n=1 Tax=Streptomyces paradoxus TaxID=66375 RepID=UPI0036FD17D3
MHMPVHAQLSPYGHVHTSGGGPSPSTNDSRSSARKPVQQPRQKAPVPKWEDNALLGVL